MVLEKGRHGGTRILARPSVELMTSDQLTAGQKAASRGVFDHVGYGFGGSVVTGRHDLTSVGTYGWDAAWARPGTSTRGRSWWSS